MDSSASADAASKPIRPAHRKGRKVAKKGTREASEASTSSNSGEPSTLLDPSEFGGAMIDPETGKEIYYCPKCNKEYGSGNGRSIWKRHIAEKHGVPLAHQPHKSRWDKSSAVSKAQSEEERRARTLESKRRWAAKNREKKKALRASQAADRNDAQLNLEELPSPAPIGLDPISPQPVWAAPPGVDLASRTPLVSAPVAKRPSSPERQPLYTSSALSRDLRHPQQPPQQQLQQQQLAGAWEPFRQNQFTRGYPPFDYGLEQTQTPSMPPATTSHMPHKPQSPEAAAISLLGLRSSSPVHPTIEQPELLHSLPSSPPLSPSRRRNRAPESQSHHHRRQQIEGDEELDFGSPVKYSPPVKHPQLGKRKRPASPSLLQSNTAAAADDFSDNESIPDLSFGTANSSASTMASGSSHHTLSTPHQASSSQIAMSSTRSVNKSRQQWLMDSYPMSSVFKSRTIRHSNGGVNSNNDFAFHLSSPMNASLSKSLGLVPDEGYYMGHQEDFHAPSEVWSHLTYPR